MNASSPASSPRASFSRRNLPLLVAGAVVLAAGYALLSGGQADVASVLLVLGYCVLLPLGIAL